MRCLILLSVLIVAALCQSCTEPVYKCVKAAEPCANKIGGSGTGSCDFTDTAPCIFCEDSICDPTSFVCQSLATKGGACTDIGGAGPLCLPGQDHSFPSAGLCISSKCGALGPILYAGDTCSKTDPLINTADTTGGCVFPATCGDDGKCTGSAVGGNCSALEGCAQGAYCNLTAGQCVPWVGAGSDCNLGQECTPDSYCTGAVGEKKCVAVFSIAAGGECDPAAVAVLQDDAQPANLLCAAGLACITDGTGKSTCVDVDDDQEGKSCETSSDCTSPFQCITNPCTDKSQCFAAYAESDSEVVSAYQAYLGCLKTNNCEGGSTPWDSGSGGGQNCAFAKCNSQWQAYIATIDYPVGDCPSDSASTVVAAVTLVAAAAAIALL